MASFLLLKERPEPVDEVAQRDRKHRVDLLVLELAAQLVQHEVEEAKEEQGVLGLSLSIVLVFEHLEAVEVGILDAELLLAIGADLKQGVTKAREGAHGRET